MGIEIFLNKYKWTTYLLASVLALCNADFADSKQKGPKHNIHRTIVRHASLPWTIEKGLDGLVKDEIRKEVAVGNISPQDDISIWIYDAKKNNELVNINASTQVDAASTSKALSGTIYFDQVSPQKCKYDPPKIRRNLELSLQTIGRDWRESIRAANRVTKRLGGPLSVNKVLHEKYGHIFRRTSIVKYIREDGKAYDDKISAEDYGRYWRALYRNEFPCSDELKRLLKWRKPDKHHKKPLRIIESDKKLPKYVEVVYNKSGTTKRVKIDGGIVKFHINGQEHVYIIVGAVQGNGDSKLLQGKNVPQALRNIFRVVPRYIEATTRTFQYN